MEEKLEKINMIQESELACNRREFKSNFRKLYLFQFLMGCHFISGVLIPFFLNWGKLTFIELMSLQSFFTIMIFIFEIPCGAISDYLSRKLSLMLGALMAAISALIYGSMPNLFIFFVGEAFFALGAALISGTDQAIVYDTLKKMDRIEEHPKIMAKMRCANLSGILIAAPIGSLLTIIIPIQYTFTLMFIPFILATIIAITIKEPNHELKKESEKYLNIIKSGFRELKNNKALRKLSIELTLIDSLVFFIVWLYQIYLEELMFPALLYGFIGSAMVLAQLMLTNLIPRMEKNIKNKKLFLMIYTLIPGIAYLLMALIFFTPISITLILIVIGFGLSREIIFIKGINKQIESDNRATVLSTISMIGGIIKGVLYPLIGFLLMYDLKMTFIFLGISIIILALASRVKNEYL